MATTKTAKRTERFNAEERAAMRDHVKEMKASDDRATGTADVLAKIAEMPEPDRVLAERVHQIVAETAPQLVPRTYYGMPAYARDGKVICFFQPASKFKVRYATLGFQHDAKVDDGSMWPVAFALTELNDANEARIRELVAKAAR